MYLTQNPAQRLPNLLQRLVTENRGNYRVTPQQGCPRLPSSIQLREYQKLAVVNWFGNSGRGTLKMATGSGKTITALAIACELYQKIGL